MERLSRERGRSGPAHLSPVRTFIKKGDVREGYAARARTSSQDSTRARRRPASLPPRVAFDPRPDLSVKGKVPPPQTHIDRQRALRQQHEVEGGPGRKDGQLGGGTAADRKRRATAVVKADQEGA